MDRFVHGRQFHKPFDRRGARALLGGPVLSFETFTTEDEAITRANATVYGLAAAVFTKDVDRAQRVARLIKAGTVWINTWGLVNDAFEEGGFKYSGIGRARGARAMEEFQEVKTQIRVAAPAPVDHPRTQTS